jgi:hypothetical protein
LFSRIKYDIIQKIQTHKIQEDLSMDTPRNFRSAFNGFNREDVVHYIEYMNSRHSTQLQELNGELEFLREKLTAAEAAPAVNSEMIDRLNAALLRIGELEARCAALEQEKQEALGKADTSDLQRAAKRWRKSGMKRCLPPVRRRRHSLPPPETTRSRSWRLTAGQNARSVWPRNGRKRYIPGSTVSFPTLP